MWCFLAFIFSNLFTMVISFIIGAHIGNKNAKEEQGK